MSKWTRIGFGVFFGVIFFIAFLNFPFMPLWEVLLISAVIGVFVGTFPYSLGVLIQIGLLYLGIHAVEGLPLIQRVIVFSLFAFFIIGIGIFVVFKVFKEREIQRLAEFHRQKAKDERETRKREEREEQKRIDAERRAEYENMKKEYSGDRKKVEYKRVKKPKPDWKMKADSVRKPTTNNEKDWKRYFRLKMKFTHPDFSKTNASEKEFKKWNEDYENWQKTQSPSE